jgi:outer membrane protein insertion porin family
VVRREIRVAEGDQYNPVQLDNAKNRIRSLGFFKADTVAVDNEPGSTSDRAVVKVKVEEEATGELAFSAGFSSQDAFLFSVSAQQRNFRGRGQYLSARIQTTARQQDLEFRFTEPKFQDRNMAAGSRRVHDTVGLLRHRRLLELDHRRRRTSAIPAVR